MNKSSLITGILAVVIGLMMVAAPATFIQVIVVLLGISAIISGIVNLAVTRSVLDDSYFKRDMTIRGIGGIVIGLLAVCLPLFVAGVMWTVMMYTLAVYLIFAAVLELHALFMVKKTGGEVRQFAVEAIITFFCAIILFLFPADFGITFIRIAGGVLLVSAVSLVIYTIKTAPIVISVETVSDDIPDNQ